MTQAFTNASRTCDCEHSHVAQSPSGGVLVAVFDESGWRIATVASENQGATLVGGGSDDPT